MLGLPRNLHCPAVFPAPSFARLFRSSLQLQIIVQRLEKDTTPRNIHSVSTCHTPKSLCTASLTRHHRYDDVLLKRCLAEAPDTHPCLKTKCGAYFFYEKLPEDKAICPNCGHSLCTRCFRPMNTHQEWKCEKITSMTGQEIVDKARETEGIKHCPGCSTLLEHAGGCNLTKCGICEKSFCWSCCRPSEDGRTVEHDYDCPSHPHYFARQQDVVTQDTVPPSPLLDMSSPGALYQPQTPHTRAMTEEAVSTVPQRAPWQHAAEWLRARDSLRRTPEDQTDNFFDGRRTIGVRPGGRRASTQESWDFSWEQASRNPSGSASNPERHAEEDGKKDK